MDQYPHPALFHHSVSTIMPVQLDKPNCRLSLDLAGVAGLLGGDDAVSAMTLGWYNTPGSFQVAKRLNSLATEPSSSNPSGGVSIDPTALLGPDRSKGPKFRASKSGTIMEDSGYLSALFTKECDARALGGGSVRPEARTTRPVAVLIADLNETPSHEMQLPRIGTSTPLFAIVPIIFSFGACVVCAVWGDWCASSLILIGIIASGLSGIVLGSANFGFTHPEPAKGSPPGDGILISDNTFVLLRGAEGAVNCVTRGKFSLCFSSVVYYNLVRWCSLLFFIQCITQLFLIPQAWLIGQVMFLSSLGVTALYNAWHASLDKEKIYRKMLFEQVLQKLTVTKYKLGTRTAAVVFTLLVLKSPNQQVLLDEFLPNDTQAWRKWKETTLEWLLDPKETFQCGDLKHYNDEESRMLEDLCGDVLWAYKDYKDYLQEHQG